ncbi:MAG TPA: hypothetical protein VEC13_00045 [Candidatus Paceibacterota bacterium]|nr:hypothetical protein [Candidatus Paceibacterota bacterium]
MKNTVHIVPEVREFPTVQCPQGFCIGDCESVGKIADDIRNGYLKWSNDIGHVNFATVKFNIRVLDRELDSILKSLNLRHANHTELCLFGTKFPEAFAGCRIVQLGTSSRDTSSSGDWQQYNSALVGNHKESAENGLWLRAGDSWGPLRCLCVVSDIRSQFSGIPAGTYVLTVKR